MSIIQDVLKEEYERLKSLEQKYEREIEFLPKGTISKRVRNGKFYFYLVYREKQKVITQYIGKIESQKSQETIEQVKKRKQLEDKLKQVRINIKELKRVINGKKI